MRNSEAIASVAGHPGRGYQLLLVLLLSLTFGIVFFDRNALSFLMPFVQPELRLSNTDIGLLAAALALSWAASGLIVGHISDRSGRRKSVLIAATLVFAACSLLSGLAASFALLFAARLLMGCAEGCVLPISQSLLVREVDPARRGAAMGFMQNFGSNFLGTFLAPILLIPIAAEYGWRSAFYVAAVPGFICAALLWWLIRESPPVAEHRTAERVPLLATLGQRNILLCTVMAICFISYLIVGLVFLPVILTQMRGLEPATMGWVMGLMGISAALGGWLIAGLSDRVGRRPVLITIPYLGLLVPLAILYFDGGLVAFAGLLVLGWFVIGCFPVFLATIPSETVDPRYIATTLGLIQAIGEVIGGVIAPTVAGAAADAWGLQAPLWILAGLALVSGLAALGLRETAPRRLGRNAQVA